MRLIDADALDAAFTDLRFNADGTLAHWGDRPDWCLHGREVEKLIHDAPTVGGWISVEDRMPKKDGQYLCWFGKNTVAIGAAIATYLEEWKAFGSLVSLETYPNVTHWMPIEPPKEEEK